MGSEKEYFQSMPSIYIFIMYVLIKILYDNTSCLTAKSHCDQSIALLQKEKKDLEFKKILLFQNNGN